MIDGSDGPGEHIHGILFLFVRIGAGLVSYFRESRCGPSSWRIHTKIIDVRDSVNVGNSRVHCCFEVFLTSFQQVNTGHDPKLVRVGPLRDFPTERPVGQGGDFMPDSSTGVIVEDLVDQGPARHPRASKDECVLVVCRHAEVENDSSRTMRLFILNSTGGHCLPTDISSSSRSESPRKPSFIWMWHISGFKVRKWRPVLVSRIL